jgi:hypothetical protein
MRRAAFLAVLVLLAGAEVPGPLTPHLQHLVDEVAGAVLPAGVAMEAEALMRVQAEALT